MQVCRVCKEAKLLDAFVKGADYKSGYKTICKSCKALENASGYQKYSEDQKLRTSLYKKANAAKVNHDSMLRHAKVALAAPAWLSTDQKEEILGKYKLSKQLSDSGVQHHVDHIVPLNGANICGLHVPWNLQVITAEENLKKSNKHP